MLAADWNEIQVRARTELRTHDHTGDATRIPRDGIADKAIDGSKVDRKAGSRSRASRWAALKVTGTSQLADIQATLASLSGDLGVGTDAPRTAKAGPRGGHPRRRPRQAVDPRRRRGRPGDGPHRGIYGAEPGLIVGTRSAHPLSLIVGGEMRLRLATKKAAFRSSTCLPDFSCASPPRDAGTTTGQALGNSAEICNDTNKYKTLMLLGNRSAGRAACFRLGPAGGQRRARARPPSTPPAGTPSAIWNKRDGPPRAI
jgi:hypothetical protein